MKKANNEQPEKDLQCQAELCGLLDILVPRDAQRDKLISEVAFSPAS
jgi:hypothetical protein